MMFIKKALVGIDLGSRTVKGIQLKVAKNGSLGVESHFFQDLALDVPVDSKLNPLEVLKAAVETKGLSSAPAAVAIHDSEVMSFTLELPVMSDKELRQVVRQEIIEQGNLQIEKYCWDFTVSDCLGKSAMITVKAYCVLRDLVVAQAATLKNAGLQPTSVESAMMAIRTMLEFNDYLNPKETVVVFDLGETHLVSALICDGVLCLTKTDPASSGSINSKLQTQCAISYKEAETFKLGFDFMEGPKGLPTKIDETVDAAFTEVFKSIKFALDFYKECPEASARIDKVLFVGGGSQTKSLGLVVERFFNIPALIVNPFRNIDIFSGFDQQASEKFSKIAPFMGGAVGLALSSFKRPKAA